MRSLRLRLLLGAALAIFIALLLSWWVMSLLFERHIERRVVDDLRREGGQLVAGLKISADGVPQLETPPADPRFEQPASGLYWQLSGDGGVLRSRSLWDDVLPTAPRIDEQRWQARIADGPFEQQVLLLERIVRLTQDGPRIRVQLACDEMALRSAREEFARELGLFLLLLWLVLSAAAAAQVQLGLRPLSRVRNELSALLRNPTARLNAAHPREIEPLTQAINALADAREKDLLRARRRAGDLAHSLKTPLAALAAQSRRAREAGADVAADGIDRAITAMNAVVESELSRARAAAIRQGNSAPASSPHEVAERIVGVVERTEAGARLLIDIALPDSLRAPLAADDLAELLGALIENAVRHARRRVLIGGRRDGERLCLTIEDDGTGIDGDIERALVRGGRLDEAGNGHGLGLAIARDIAEASGAVLTLSRSELGGLCVTIAWQ